MDIQRAIELIEKEIGNQEYDLKNQDIPLPIRVMVMEDIEAMKIAVESMKLRVALPPELEGDGYADGAMVYETWYCPNCGKSYEVYSEQHDCCPKCGQKILWEDTSNGENED